nr:putative E3 ubiquitin-protein ligase RF298 [Ipomoea batatas]
MADQRAKEAGGDSKNGDSNEKLVFPGVNDSKDYLDFSIPLFDGIESLAAYILLEMAVEHGTVNTNPVLCSEHSQCENKTPRGSSKASVVSAPQTSGAARRNIELRRVLVAKVPSSSGGKKNKGSGVVSVSSLPAVTSKAEAVVKQENKPTVKAPGSSAVPSSVHISEKDERIVALMVRKQLLQQELEGWTDWASEKVREAAQKLSKEQPDRAQKARGRTCQAEERDCRFTDEKYTVLCKSGGNCGEGAGVQLLKQCQTLEGETSLQARIDKARKREGEFEALRQHEEREKIKNLQKLESIRSKREQWKRQS